MNIKQLFNDEDAVSPVIGVILMVAITVILAAVIGTFVLGLGDQVQTSAPSANFQFDYGASADGFTAGDGNEDTIGITHNGGQDVSVGNVDVQVGSVTIDDVSDTATIGVNTAWPDTIATGNTLTIGDNVDIDGDTNPEQFESGQTVRIIWQSDSGGSSNTIGTSTVPS